MHYNLQIVKMNKNINKIKQKSNQKKMQERKYDPRIIIN